MTRNSLVRVVKKSLEKHQGSDSSTVAERIADAIEIMLEIESEQGEAETPIDFPLIQEKEKKGLSMKIPSSPAVEKAPEPRMIVLPGEEKAPAPIRMARIQPETQTEPEPEKHYWSAESLIQYLEENTPEQLEITPYGTDKKVVLSRNILNGLALDAVKLIYNMSYFKSPSPSGFEGVRAADGSARLGVQQRDSVAAPTSIDLPVAETFFLADKDPQVQQKMDIIIETAKKMYVPRVGPILSRTPIRMGTAMTFDERDPHADV